MSALTAEEFSKHLNTNFRIDLGEQKLGLKLVEVKRYLPQEHEQTDLERFSVFFDGPNYYLPQRLYSVEHEQMGRFDIFLVPIAQNGQTFRYEAVFNYYKTKPDE